MPKLINLLAYDLIDQLSAYIQDSQLTPGAKLPSERNLADRFQVNRTTLRGALQKLVDNGILSTQSNSGYYLMKPKFSKNAYAFFTPHEDPSLAKHQIELKEISLKPATLSLLLDKITIKVPEHAAAYLEFIDGEVLSLFVFIPLLPEIIELKTSSPFQIFQETDYLRSQEITLSLNHEPLKKWLTLEEEDLLLFVQEEITKDQQPVALALGYTISKRCTILVVVATTLQAAETDS